MLVIAVILPLINIGIKYIRYSAVTRENNTSIFVSQFSTGNFEDEMLEKYLGGEIYVCEEDSLAGVGRRLRFSIDSQDMKVVRIGLDPMNKDYSFSAGNRIGRFVNRSFYSAIEKNPDVRFEILLYSPTSKEWNEKDIDKTIESYENLVNSLDVYENVFIFFPGAEEWVLSNKTLRDGDRYEETVAEEFVASCFASCLYDINSANQWEKYNQLKAVCLSDNTTEYINLEGYEIAFLGDSVFANYTGASSIPGAVKGICGADYINYGAGGQAATDVFVSLVTEFTEKYPVREKRIYVINFGLNDYFRGYETEGQMEGTYQYALETGVRKLKEYDPDGMIIICGATYNYYCEDGDGTFDENGRPLSEYINVAKNVAAKENVRFIDYYEELGIDKSNHQKYLVDGIHPGSTTRMIYSKILVKHIEEWIE